MKQAVYILDECQSSKCLTDLKNGLTPWNKIFFGGWVSLINLAIRFPVGMDIIVSAVNNEPCRCFYVHTVSPKSIFRHVYRGVAEGVYSPRRVFLCTAHRKGRGAPDGLE